MLEVHEISRTPAVKVTLSAGYVKHLSCSKEESHSPTQVSTILWQKIVPPQLLELEAAADLNSVSPLLALPPKRTTALPEGQ